MMTAICREHYVVPISRGILQIPSHCRALASLHLQDLHIDTLKTKAVTQHHALESRFKLWYWSSLTVKSLMYNVTIIVNFSLGALFQLLGGVLPDSWIDHEYVRRKSDYAILPLCVPQFELKSNENTTFQMCGSVWHQTIATMAVGYNLAFT